MTVENQIPYQSFTANGEQASFILGFYVENKENFSVKINGSLSSSSSYTYNKSTNAVVFNTAPFATSLIEVERNTTPERSINYSTSNNTFRPEVLNQDFDRIWLKMQELGVTDEILFNKITKEILNRADSDLEIRALIEAQLDNIAKEGIISTLAVTSTDNLTTLNNLEKWSGRIVYVKNIGNYVYNNVWEPVTSTNLINDSLSSTDANRALSAKQGKILQDNKLDKTASAASATKLTTARNIGGVSFDGTASINLAGVNVTGNQDTSGSAASIKIPSTSNSVKLYAMWSGAIFNWEQVTLTADSANTVWCDVSFNGSLYRNLLKSGAVLHLAYFSNWWNFATVNLTITGVSYGITGENTARIFATFPNHGITIGNSSTYRVMAITYSAYGCSFYGNVQQYLKTNATNAQRSFLLQTTSTITNADVKISTSGDTEIYNSTYDLAYMAEANALSSAAVMVKGNLCNFNVNDNNNDTTAKCSYVTITVFAA
ncbi:hypothetical protein [Acinetobacter seifertii]|uniref:hypothetical protein n=1 Tax=Acinetobacter seifertii TaxID=1530123 RepID=UPI0038623B58